MITIEYLKNQYKSYLQALNSNINAYAPYSFWDIDAGAMAAILLDLYANLNIVENDIYAQNDTGDKIDKRLYSLGMVARGGETFAIARVTLKDTGSITLPITIAKDTIFTDIGVLIDGNYNFTTGNQFKLLQDVTVTTFNDIFPLYALTAGNDYTEYPNSELQNTTLNYIVTVSTFTTGRDEESDQMAVSRILQFVRTPRAGARSSDYFQYALEANENVTYAIVIPGFYQVNNVNILGIFPLVGEPLNEFQLNQGLINATTFIPYSRQAPTDVIESVKEYIISQQLVGLIPVVHTSITKNVTNAEDPIQLTVSLATGYTLETSLLLQSQGSDGSPTSISITVKQLIQREIRRIIVNFVFGGVIIGNNRYITIENFIVHLNDQLSNLRGQIMQLITNINFQTGDILLPGKETDSNGNISWIYDISSYADIEVTQV